MDIKDIILQVMPMTDNMAGKVLKNVFKAVSNGEGLSTNLFGRVIDELNNKTVAKRLNVVPATDIEKQFEEFRLSYKGTKRGFATEFGNFKRKHEDWKEVVPKLMQAWINEVTWHERLKSVGAFCPEYKNLQTWINQRCWEQELNLDQLNNDRGARNRKAADADNARNAIRKLATEFS